MPTTTALGSLREKSVVPPTTTRIPQPVTVPCATDAPRMPLPQNTLLRWNLFLACMHAALAITTCAVGKLDLGVDVYKTRIDLQYANGSTRDGAWELVPVYERSGTLPFTWLVVLFFVISSVFHLLNCTLLRTLYLTQLSLCYTPTRWVEYSFSAPIMIVLISYTLGVRNRDVLLAEATLVLVTMPFGYWTETLARPVSLDDWNLPLVQRLLPWVVGHIPQTVAWLFVILQFYDGHDTKDRAPTFVHVILWGELVLFFSFGGAALLSQWTSPRFFYRGEIMFQVLSLVSKGLLGILLLVNVLMLQRFDDMYDDDA
jgi:hypothetical protein